MLSFGVKAQNIIYYLEPEHDNRFMAWQPGPDLGENPDSWKVEIFQLDSLGNETNLLYTETTNSNFTRIPENLLNGKYGIKVSAMFGDSDVEGDIKYACEHCWGDLLKSWICNGPRYAYQLSHWESHVGFYYSISGAYQTINGVSTPFVFYLNQQDYDNYHDALGFPGNLLLDFNSHSFYDYTGNYLTIGGGPIFGKVYAIHKNMGKYADYPHASTPTATTNFWPSMSFYAGRVNYNANTNLGGLDPLDCDAEFLGGGFNPEFPSIKDDVVFELANNEGGIGEHTITTESINYALWDRLREFNEQITDSIGMPNEGHTQFFDIMISRVDKTEEQLSFDPESIFHENGFVEYPETPLNDGLYRLTVRFKGYQLVSTLFQFELEPTYSFHATIADSVTVGAYPNPVTENYIQVSLGSERDLEVQMRILGSDGILRHTEDVIITQELGQDFSLNLAEFNLQGNNYFFLQFLFSDQSIISKTILLPNN